MVRWGRVGIGVGILSLVGVAGVKVYQHVTAEPPGDNGGIPAELINEGTDLYAEFVEINQCLPRPHPNDCYFFDIKWKNNGEIGSFNFKVDDWYAGAWWVNNNYLYAQQYLNILAQLKWLGHMSEEDYNRLEQEMIDAGWF